MMVKSTIRLGSHDSHMTICLAHMMSHDSPCLLQSTEADSKFRQCAIPREFPKLLPINVISVGVPTPEKQPHPPCSGPIPILVPSVFQEPQERSDARPGANHNEGNGGVFGKMKRIHPPGGKGNLGKFTSLRRKIFRE